jgi:membrane-bound lytic murein transglycosylase D
LERYLQNTSFNHTVLRRRSIYAHKVLPLLKKVGVAEELLLVAGIESNYYPRARSQADAVGLWQFIRTTGARYGLRYSAWFDERRDIRKATLAAAKHLRDLFNEFQSWELALAAYNCGAGCVQRFLKRCPNRPFWEMRSSPECKIPQETRQYVMRFFTMVYLFRHPPNPPLRLSPPKKFARIKLTKPISLPALSAHLKVSLKQVHAWNPELSSWATPPLASYSLIVPPVYLSAVKQYLRQRGQIELAVVASNSLASQKQLARRYGIDLALLRSLNHIYHKDKYAKFNSKLLVPVIPSKTKARCSPSQKIFFAWTKPLRQHYPQIFSHIKPKPKKQLCYVVKSWDTFWHLGRRFGIAYQQLARWNGNPRHLRPGQILRLDPNIRCLKRNGKIHTQSLRHSKTAKAGRHSKTAKAGRHSKTAKAVRHSKTAKAVRHSKTAKAVRRDCHVVRKGDTIWGISQRYNIPVDNLQKLNPKLKKNIYVNQVIRLTSRARCPTKPKK